MPLPDTPYILSTDAWAFITGSNYAAMRESLGVGPTDIPTFSGLNLSDGWGFISNSSYWRLNSGNGSQGHLQIAPGVTILNGRQLTFLDATIINISANILEQRNSTAPQTFRVYNTFPGNGNNEYGEITWDASTLYFRPAATGTAAIRNTVIGSSGSVTNLDATVITFRPGGASRFVINSGGLFATNDNQVDIGASGGNRPRNVYVANGLTTGSISPNSGTDLIFNGASTGAAWKITPSGHFHAFADNAYDIGASGANRPRNVYAGTLITAPTVNGSVNMTTGNNGYGGGLNLVSSGWITNQDAGVIGIFNQAKTDAPFIVIGGTTAGFPAIKRNGAGLQIRLANDSANATLEAGNLYASGNVGIGTTAPTAPLEIRGAAVTNTRENLLKCTMNDAGNDAFHIYNGTGFDTRFSPAFSGSVFSGSGAAPALNFVGQTTSANDTGTVPLSIFQGRITSSETDPNNGTFSNVATRPLFGWWNVTTPLMQLNANGNLGIGTTAPGAKLDIVTSAAYDGLKVTNSHTTSGAIVSFVNNVGSNGVFGCYSSGTADGLANNAACGAKNSLVLIADGEVFSGGTNSIQLRTGGYGTAQERMRISASGNVGIGTTAPGSALHISGALGSNTTTYDSAAALKLTNTTGNSSWLLTSGVIGVVNASFSIRQEGVSLPSFVISNLGNVGIGTTSPSSKLHVAGTIKPEQATITTNATTAITLDISHAGTVLTTSNAGNVTITLPAAGTVGVGYNVMIIQGGAGPILVQAGAGNTLNSFGSLYSSAGLHAAICIVCTAANTYNISGNLA